MLGRIQLLRINARRDIHNKKAAEHSTLILKAKKMQKAKAATQFSMTLKTSNTKS